MIIIDINKFPSLKVGNREDNTARDFRLALAPELKNEERITLVYVTIPPGTQSDYHMHDETDELM